MCSRAVKPLPQDYSLVVPIGVGRVTGGGGQNFGVGSQCGLEITASRGSADSGFLCAVLADYVYLAWVLANHPEGAEVVNMR